MGKELNNKELALVIAETLKKYEDLDIFEKEMLSMRLELIQKDLKKGENEGA